VTASEVSGSCAVWAITLLTAGFGGGVVEERSATVAHCWPIEKLRRMPSSACHDLCCSLLESNLKYFLTNTSRPRTVNLRSKKPTI